MPLTSQPCLRLFSRFWCSGDGLTVDARPHASGTRRLAQHTQRCHEDKPKGKTIEATILHWQRSAAASTISLPHAFPSSVEFSLRLISQLLLYSKGYSINKNKLSLFLIIIRNYYLKISKIKV
jgi:hypothetical protein